MSSNLHILGLSEKGLHDYLPSSIYNLSCDFDVIRLDRNWYKPGISTIKKGGGVCIFIKNSLQYSDFDYKPLNISSKDIEAQWGITQPHAHISSIQKGLVISILKYEISEMSLFHRVTKQSKIDEANSFVAL